MRRKLLMATAGAALLAIGSIRPSFAVGVPTFDAANFAEWIQKLQNDAQSYELKIKSWSVQNLQWMQQVESYAKQLQQLLVATQTMNGFIHAPNLGSAMMFLTQIGLNNIIPINPMAVFSLIQGLEYGQGGLPEIANLAGSIGNLSGNFWTKNHVFTPTDNSWSSLSLIARGNSIAGVQGLYGAELTDFQNHASTLPVLRAQLATANDPKAVQDIQAQIALENAWNMNEAGQQSAIHAMAVSQSDAQVQRDNEKVAEDLEAFLSSSPTPNP